MVRTALCALVLLSGWVCAHGAALPAPLRAHSTIMLLIDPIDGRIVDANEEAQRFYGYTQLGTPGAMRIQEINQLSEAEIRAEIKRAAEQKRRFFLFPHRLASGEVVTVEVHSSPVVIDGKQLLLSIILPESHSAALNRQLQTYEKRLESLVAERTEQVLQAERARMLVLRWSLAASALMIAGLAAALLMLRQTARARQRLAADLANAQEAARMGRLVWDLVAKTLYVDRRLRTMLGWPAHADAPIAVADWFQRVHEDDRDSYRAVLRAHLRTETPAVDALFRIRHAHGHWVWLQGWGRVVERDPRTQQALRFLGLVHDVSEEQALRQLRAVTASVFEDAGEAIIVTDEHGTVLEVNRAMTSLCGYTRDELVGRRDWPWRPDRAQDEQQGWKRVGVGNHARSEVSWHRHDGSTFPVIETVSAVRDGHGRIIRYVILGQDISELKAQQEALQRQAYYDLLTGLPNRVLLADRLTQALANARRRQQRVAVVYLDLDGFKAVNDRHGHDEGERVLYHMAQQLRQTLREGDTLARVGGDEFVAVLTDIGADTDWRSVVERLLSAGSAPVTLDDRTHQLSASLGVTLYPDDDAPAEILLRHADQAMYRAKREGKNRWILFDPREDRAASERTRWIADVRRALRSTGEFQLYLQPRVHLRDGSIEGAEALLRWQHPERGLLAPGVFLPFIETDDVMVELGEWVLAEALRLLQQWHDAQAPAWTLSINIAPRQLSTPDFSDRLAQILAAHPNVEARRLELEIVESSTLEGVDQLQRLLQRCRRLGVALAIDDFGTRYSSLSYLKRLPATAVKIDQSFIRDVFDDANDLRIVEGVIALGHAFGLRVVAEGVETVAHSNLLLRLGADIAQGYGIARPMPSQQWNAWAAAWQAPPSWQRWQAVASTPWSRVLARLEVEHRSVLWGLQARQGISSAATCAFHTALAAAVPAIVQQWPEYAALLQAHEAFHAAAQHWAAHSSMADDPLYDPAVVTAQQALTDALYALLNRLAGQAQAQAADSVSL